MTKLKASLVLIGLVLVVLVLSAGAQTTAITDDPSISTRFDRIGGEWNLVYLTGVPPYNGTPDVYSARIYHAEFKHVNTTYTAEFSAEEILRDWNGKPGEDEIRVYKTPIVFTLDGVNDVSKGGYPRTEFIFRRTYVKKGNIIVDPAIHIFFIPDTGLIVGKDYMPNIWFDGVWAGRRGTLPNLDRYGPEFEGLAHRCSLQKGMDNWFLVLESWAGF